VDRAAPPSLGHIGPPAEPPAVAAARKHRQSTTTVPPASCAGVQRHVRRPATQPTAPAGPRAETPTNQPMPPASRARPSAPPAAGVAPSHPPVNHHQLARPRQPHERNYHRPLPILPCRSPPPTLPPPLLSPGPPAARPDVPTIFAARRTLATSRLRPPRRGKGAAYDAE